MDVGNWIAIGAVFVALITLIWQTRKSTTQAKMQNFSTYTERYQTIMLHFPIDVESSDFHLDSLPEEDKETLLRWFRAYFDLCSEEYYLMQQGCLEKKVWRLWNGGMRDAFKRPAYQRAWEILQVDRYYSLEFEKFVKESSP